MNESSDGNELIADLSGKTLSGVDPLIPLRGIEILIVATLESELCKGGIVKLRKGLSLSRVCEGLKFESRKHELGVAFKIRNGRLTEIVLIDADTKLCLSSIVCLDDDVSSVSVEKVIIDRLIERLGQRADHLLEA